MRLSLRFVYLSTFASLSLPLLACGRGASVTEGSGFPSIDASTDASAPPPSGSFDGGIQGTVDAAPPDASAASEDAGSFDAGPPDQSAPDPLAACMTGDRDVFYINAAAAGDFEKGAETFTNLGATWLVSTGPLDIMAGSATFQLALTDGGPPVPGHYVLAPNGPVYGALDDLGDACSFSSGSIDVVDYETYVTDAKTTEVSSLLLSYALDCDSVPVQGCVKYAIAPVDLTPPDAGAEDGGVLAPCQSGDYVFYVSHDGGEDAGLPSPIAVTGASGTWGVSGEGVYQFNVSDTNMAPWALALQTAPESELALGTYTSTGTDLETPWIQVKADGIGCHTVPTGTFSITTLEMQNDQLAKIVVGFDLACPNLGIVKGCLSYGQ